MKFFVYTLYNNVGEPIYVGQTRDLPSRLANHRGQEWGKEVVWWTTEPCESRRQAFDVEKSTIRRLRPRHNRTHNRDIIEGTSVHTSIPDDLHRALKILAAQEGVSLKDLVIRLLTEAVSPKSVG